MAKNQYEDLTDQQRLFADYYFELNHGTKAAIKAGYAEKAAHVQASKLLKNGKVREYIEGLHKERRERIMNRLAAYAEEAVEDLRVLAKDADSEAVRLQANKDIMDRSGYKPTDKIESKTDLNGKIEFGFRDPLEEE
jgi:phage terminase small subunit